MKKITLLLFCSTIALNSFGQSDVSGTFIGHQRAAGRFCGWSPGLGSTAGSFEIRNDFAGQPINFFAGGSIAAFQRMTILGTNGFVGIGDNFTTPASLLHVNGTNNATGNLFRTDGSNTVNNQWQLFTNNTERFKLFVNTGATHVGLQAAGIC